MRKRQCFMWSPHKVKWSKPKWTLETSLSNLLRLSSITSTVTLSTKVRLLGWTRASASSWLWPVPRTKQWISGTTRLVNVKFHTLSPRSVSQLLSIQVGCTWLLLCKIKCRCAMFSADNSLHSSLLVWRVSVKLNSPTVDTALLASLTKKFMSTTSGLQTEHLWWRALITHTACVALIGGKMTKVSPLAAWPAMSTSMNFTLKTATVSVTLTQTPISCLKRFVLLL